MADDVDFKGDDVFADIDSDPLADTAEEVLPDGVSEAELAGDNPSEVPPEEFLKEPDEPEDPALPEPESDPEAEAAAKAIEDKAIKEAAERAAEAEAEPEPPAAEPDPEPLAPEPTPEPDPAPEPATPDPEPDPPAEPPVAADPPPEPKEDVPPVSPPHDGPPEKPKKPAKKPGKKRGRKKAKGSKGTLRTYVILYHATDDTIKVGAKVEARDVERAIKAAYPLMKESTGESAFKGVVAVPGSNWNPQPVGAEREEKDIVKIG